MKTSRQGVSGVLNFKFREFCEFPPKALFFRRRRRIFAEGATPKASDHEVVRFEIDVRQVLMLSDADSFKIEFVRLSAFQIVIL